MRRGPAPCWWRASGGRRARASGLRAGALLSRCEACPAPWLAGAGASVPRTDRERQVAALAAGGSSDAAIAARLGISIRTVQTHLAHVYAKLGATGRAELPALLGDAPGSSLPYARDSRA